MFIVDPFYFSDLSVIFAMFSGRHLPAGRSSSLMFAMRIRLRSEMVSPRAPHILRICLLRPSVRVMVNIFAVLRFTLAFAAIFCSPLSLMRIVPDASFLIPLSLIGLWSVTRYSFSCLYLGCVIAFASSPSFVMRISPRDSLSSLPIGKTRFLPKSKSARDFEPSSGAADVITPFGLLKARRIFWDASSCFLMRFPSTVIVSEPSTFLPSAMC